MTDLTPHRRTVADQDVLTVRRLIGIDDLDDFLEEAMDTLERLAPAAGAQFVRYEDGLTAERDGTVEVCQPIDERCPRHLDLPEGVGRRVEPAHVEAWITVTKAELAFPDIDEIYAALDQEVVDLGWERCGVPREVYWADWDDTSMEDPVCDVCFPVCPLPGELPS